MTKCIICNKNEVYSTWFGSADYCSKTCRNKDPSPRYENDMNMDLPENAEKPSSGISFRWLDDTPKKKKPSSKTKRSVTKEKLTSSRTLANDNDLLITLPRNEKTSSSDNTRVEVAFPLISEPLTPSSTALGLPESLESTEKQPVVRLARGSKDVTELFTNNLPLEIEKEKDSVFPFPLREDASRKGNEMQSRKMENEERKIEFIKKENLQLRNTIIQQDTQTNKEKQEIEELQRKYSELNQKHQQALLGQLEVEKERLMTIDTIQSLTRKHELQVSKLKEQIQTAEQQKDELSSTIALLELEKKKLSEQNVILSRENKKYLDALRNEIEIREKSNKEISSPQHFLKTQEKKLNRETIRLTTISPAISVLKREKHDLVTTAVSSISSTTPAHIEANEEKNARASVRESIRESFREKDEWENYFSKSLQESMSRMSEVTSDIRDVEIEFIAVKNFAMDSMRKGHRQCTLVSFWVVTNKSSCMYDRTRATFITSQTGTSSVILIKESVQYQLPVLSVKDWNQENNLYLVIELFFSSAVNSLRTSDLNEKEPQAVGFIPFILSVKTDEREVGWVMDRKKVKDGILINIPLYKGSMESKGVNRLLHSPLEDDIDLVWQEKIEKEKLSGSSATLLTRVMFN